MFEENIEWGKCGDEYDRDAEATRFWESGAIDRGPVASHVDDKDEDGAEFDAVKPHRPAANGNTVHRIVAVGSEAQLKAMIGSGHRLVATVGTAAGGSEQGTSIDAALGTLESMLDEPVRVTVVTGLANDPAQVELVFGVAVDLEETACPGMEANPLCRRRPITGSSRRQPARRHLLSRRPSQRSAPCSRPSFRPTYVPRQTSEIKVYTSVTGLRGWGRSS